MMRPVAFSRRSKQPLRRGCSVERKVAGITLLEIITVIAITTFLAAILLNVFARSKERAHEAVDLSNLKQVAMAAQIYSEATGYPATSIWLLHNARYAPASVLVSPKDPTRLGVLNEMNIRRFREMELTGVRQEGVFPPAEVRISYVGLRDFVADDEYVKKEMNSRRNLGWAVVPRDFEGAEKFPFMRPPWRYFRLMEDGSVHPKTAAWHVENGQRIFTPLDLFGDRSQNE